MAVTIQYILVVNTNLTVACVLVFIVGAYMMLFSLIRDIGSVIGSINEHNKTKKTRLKAAAQLLEFVQLHAHAIQLSLLNVMIYFVAIAQSFQNGTFQIGQRFFGDISTIFCYYVLVDIRRDVRYNDVG